MAHAASLDAQSLSAELRMALQARQRSTEPHVSLLVQCREPQMTLALASTPHSDTGRKTATCNVQTVSESRSQALESVQALLDSHECAGKRLSGILRPVSARPCP